METPRFVRCKDNTLAREALSIGRIYEVGGERFGNYMVLGHWFTKARFEPVTREDWAAQR